MAKVSPIVRAFNAGEFSALMDGRTDLDRYPAASRQAINVAAAPQGPAIPRSGTQFINEVWNSDSMSRLVPFLFSETDFYMVEFADEVCRWFTEDGVLTYAAVAATVFSTTPFVVKVPGLTANIGDQLALSGFDPQYNLDGLVVNITAVSTAGGDPIYTLDIDFPALAAPTGAISAALVYSIPSPYGVDDIDAIFDLQSLDVIYLFHPDIITRKLSRYDTYDWKFEDTAFQDGPYLATNEGTTTLTYDVTGKATPDMTSNTAPSGTCFASGAATGFPAYYAFDGNLLTTYWDSNANQSGQIGYHFPTAVTIDGYCIGVGIDNVDLDYTSVDYAPCDFTFEASNDGTNWTILDKQAQYVLYDTNYSTFFKIPNQTAYLYYRVNVASCYTNGAINCHVGALIMRSTESRIVNVTASDTAGINNDAGFATTDVGRLIRIEGSDGNWRALQITAVTDSQHVTCKLIGSPFPDITPTINWRIGVYSDTTGYPNVGCFYDDRLWTGGSNYNPDQLCASQTGSYENFSPTADDGEVLDTNGISVSLNSRTLSRIKWMLGTKQGLLLGTGSEERLVTSADGSGKVITPSTIVANPISARGSSDTPPAQVNDAVLAVQRSGRTVREYAYSYDVDSFKSPSMSQLASHLGISPFKRMAYASEPYNIVWFLRENGTVCGLTYNRDENVIGWHRHDFNGVVESIAVLPSSDQQQDVLWLIVNRTIDGKTKRYVEKLTPFWDFDMTIDDAWYVDCALSYSGDPIDTIYGLGHLEGREDIYGLADGIPFGPNTITGGKTSIPATASKIVVGIGFESVGETTRLENGAQDGTAMGKVKRMENISAMVWESYGGSLGVWNYDTQTVDWMDLSLQSPSQPGIDQSVIEDVSLFTGIIGPFCPDGNYDKNGSISYRRNKETPLPFNLVALMPQMNTQDR